MKKIYVLGLIVSIAFLVVAFTANKVDAYNVSYIYVDVKGEVNNPGVYRLAESSRAFQAIELAGGLTSDAYTKDVNLAHILEDEEIIYIPYEGEEASDEIASSKININKATVEELELLNGIGNVTAQNIVAYREENGPFTSIEDIKNVTNIKDAVYEKIKNYITV